MLFFKLLNVALFNKIMNLKKQKKLKVTMKKSCVSIFGTPCIFDQIEGIICSYVKDEVN